MSIYEQYYSQLAAAYVRGKLSGQFPDHPAFLRPLEKISKDDICFLVQLGKEQQLKLHKFKRNRELPRIRKVLGILKGLHAENLLDVGSGRGVFLWPLLETFSALQVQCVDILGHRVDDINAIKIGGMANVMANKMSVTDLKYNDNCFDVMTLLEVLEHIPKVEVAIKEACRVTRSSLIISVPSKEDSNPEHIHLLDQTKLKNILLNCNITNVKFEYVLNHMIVLARK